MSDFQLQLRSQTFGPDADGYHRWHVRTEERVVPAEAIAVLLCDVWDHHWCRGAEERLEAMIPRMNATVKAARERGSLVIHSPSDTMEFYKDHPARRRIQSRPGVEPPPPGEHPDPPLPIDDSDGGADTGEIPWHKAWSRQHAGIEIDAERDVISDRGEEIYGFLQSRGISQLLVLGVHTNMCILHRPFGIKAMVRWGLETALVRDLTDTMYNPAMSPYIPHEEGTRLVVEFIEKFWCPTVLSGDLVG